MTNINRRALLLFFVLLVASVCATGAGPTVRALEPSLVAEARELVDTYYGNRDNLLKASALLERAYAADPQDARIFVEAARISVMGGYLKFGKYQAGTFERYEALLDTAISLDPNNAKAHILKAQVFEEQKQYSKQLAELDKARALGTSDPWLALGYASYFLQTNAISEAFEQYTLVEQRGPGPTASTRKAYVDALRGLRSLPSRGEDVPARIRKYAEIAMAARYPTDAWTPLSYAEDFIDYQIFDEAIHYSREALKTMDFNAGRLTLAASLYGRAAQLIMKKAPKREVTPLLKEAKAMGYSQSAILDYLINKRGYHGDNRTLLEPTLRSIIP